MSTERVVRLDDFRKSPIDSSRRHDPLFMMLYRPAELREWCKDASIEAKALALELLVETFCRGKAFASEEEEAAAVRIDGIHHMQTRRVRRIKEQSPGGFTLIEGLIEAACGKYPEGKRPAKSGKRGRKRGHNHLGNRVGNQGENQGEKRGVFSSKTPANPQRRGARQSCG